MINFVTNYLTLYPTSGLKFRWMERTLPGSSGFFVCGGVVFFIGFLIQFFPSVILSTEIQNKGKQQSNLYSVSAGSDLRMSTLRPNPYLSIEYRSEKG